MGDTRSLDNGTCGIYELLSIFPTQFNGHGFLIREYIRDYTKLQEGPLRPLLRAP